MRLNSWSILVLQRWNGDLRLVQNRRRESTLLPQKSGEHVFDIKLLMREAYSLRLRRAERLLEFFSEAIDVHGKTLVLSYQQ
jgi:hypothetical protein